MPKHQHKELENLAGVQLVKPPSLDQKIEAPTKLYHNPSTTLRKLHFRVLLRDILTRMLSYIQTIAVLIQDFRIFMKQSITVLESMCGEWRTQTGCNRFGVCSSADTWENSTASAKSTFIHHYVTEFVGRHNVRPKTQESKFCCCGTNCYIDIIYKKGTFD